MDDSFLAAKLAEFLVYIGSLFLFIFRYKDVIRFGVKIIKGLYRPIVAIYDWVMLPGKVRDEQQKSLEQIANLTKSLNELSEFVKAKLSYNGGSSPVDMIRRIETRLIMQEHCQKALLLDAEDGIFLCDTGGKNLWVNRTYARFLGCGMDELLGLSWKKFVKTEELTRYNGIWQTAFADGCEFDAIVNFTNVNGHTIGLRISVSVISGENKEVIGYVGQVMAL